MHNNNSFLDHFGQFWKCQWTPGCAELPRWHKHTYLQLFVKYKFIKYFRKKIFQDCAKWKEVRNLAKYI
jgi:hypothetical protein